MLETPGKPLDVSFFADVIRDSPVPTCILAPDRTVLFWNSAVERLTGWSPEEVLGRQLPLVPPQRMDEHLQLWRRSQEGEGFAQRRVTRRDKKGRTLEASLSMWPIRDADGHVTATIVVYADVHAEESRLRESLAEKQLEEVERLYATAPVGLAFLDTELRFVRVSERLAQLNGRSPEGHVGKRLADIVPEAAALMEDNFREVIATGAPLTDHELRAATQALPGVPRDWQVSAYPLKAPDGRVIGITVAVSDITERKRWSDELKRQEALLRLVIDALPGLVLYLDRDYRYRLVNRTAAEWFQRPPSDIVGHKVAEVLGEAIAKVVRERADRALAGEPVVFDGPIRYPDREREVHLHYVPDRGPDGRVRGMVSLVQDVTEQKRAERALQDSEERFRRIVEIAVEGIWIVDATGMTGFVNDRMAAILGYPREEMLGRFCFDFFDPEERARARQEFEERKILTPEPQEYRFCHKNGSTVWLDITGTPMTDDAGAFTGVLKMCTDVTERKIHEQRLRQLQKLESLGILAGGVAHDFNNLLTSVMGNASLVLETTDPESHSRAMLQSIVAASEQAAQLTRQLLIYAGKDQGKLQPVDVGAIARDLVRVLATTIPKTVQLSLEVGESVLMVEANPAHLQHMMMNLVINAAEAIPERSAGEVKLAVGCHTLKPEDSRDAVVPLEAGGRECCVSVSVTDNGSGMDADTQSRIFDPFFTTKFQGRGLGLPEVLGIVKGYGGTVTVRSTPGQGSVFTVWLPASGAADLELPAAPARGAAAAGTGVILFADGDEALRAIAQHILEAQGYSVLPAANGRQAIAALEAHPEIRAVVLDLAMPVMGGDAAGPILHALRPDVPLILSSGYSESFAVQRVGPGVVAAFLAKPYQPDALVAKLEEVLRSLPSN
jgi:PAS domain S-box-containing protein